MDYSEFLLANLLMNSHPEWEHKAYDDMFADVQNILPLFEESTYNVDDRSEYDCMVDWINEEYKKETEMKKEELNVMTINATQNNIEIPTIVRKHIVELAKPNKIAYEELIAQVSGEYLTEPITVVEQLSISDSDEFNKLIEERLTEPFEDYNSADVWEMIVNGADSLKRFLEFKQIM